MQNTLNAINPLQEICTNRIQDLLGKPGGEGLNMSGVPRSLAEMIIEKLVQSGKLEARSLAACAAVSLKRLDLRGVAAGEDIGWAVQKIVEVAEGLEEVFVPHCQLSCATLRLLSSKHAASLRCIDLSSCKINPKSVQLLLRKCSELEEVNLSGSTIDDSAFSVFQQETPLFDDPVRPFFWNKRKRTADHLEDYHFSVKRRKLEDNKQMTVNFFFGSKMRELKISGCRLTSKSMLLIAKVYPNLLSLDCSHIENVLDINPILNGCPQLTSLNINGCNISQKTEFAIGKNLSLSDLHFSGSGVLNSKFLSLLGQCAPTLQHIRIRNKSFDPGCTDPTSWLADCVNLKTLDIYGIHLGKNFILDLMKCGGTLEYLDITHCYPISNEHANVLSSASFPNIRSLTINQPAIVKILPALGKSCPNLSNLCLNLDMKGLLDENEILEFLVGMKQIKELELWGCKSLSLDTAKRIIHICSQLKCLLVSTADPNINSPSLSANEFKQLQLEYPNIQFKIWHHSIEGNRHFRYHKGTDDNQYFNNLNTIEVKLQVTPTSSASKSQIVPVVLVDNIPIWSNESSASLGHLRKTTEGGENSGALPLISEWCCECNIHNYNGVLFYHDEDVVFWETHEPGIKQRFKFSKEQYTKAINDARLHHLQLVWQQAINHEPSLVS